MRHFATKIIAKDGTENIWNIKLNINKSKIIL